MLDTVTEYLTPEHTRLVLLVLRLLFLGSLAALLLGLSCRHVPGPRRRDFRTPLLLLLVISSFLAVYANQARWQLAGFLDSKFVSFMERYNPRPENAAAKLVRGRILDCDGRELAVSAPDVRGFRRYPYGPSVAHVVGYRDPLYGRMGMERAADAVICGYLFNPTSRTDLARIGQTVLLDQRPVGHNIVLTLDAELQAFALSLFDERDWRGAAVAIDPRDGCIRLLATAPSFDPNGYDPRSVNRRHDSPLTNRAIQGLYPPGSTFKLAIAALAIECGKGGTYDCPGEGWIPPGTHRPIRDHERLSNPSWPGFGRLDLPTALAKSSNTYFAQAGVASGPAAFNALADALCINRSVLLYESPTGSRMAANPGSVPVLGSGRGALRELSQLSIGQGSLVVTPLHIAMLGAAVANDGTLYRPHLAAMDVPEILSTPFRPATARKVRDLMRGVVLSGTGRKADIPGLEVAGKTGTAQNPHGKDHGWFVCMAPVSAPELVVAVVVENQGFGSQTALPIARAILEKARELGYFTTPGGSLP